MTTTYPFTDLRYLPGKLVTNKNDAEGIKKYEAMTPDDKKKFGGLWWSLHDIIETFGSGIFKEENDANFFSYVIDLDADHFKELRLVDPNLAMTIDRDMTTNLTGVSAQISNTFNQQKMASSDAMSAAVVGVAAANKPFMMGGPQQNPAANGMPNANAVPNATGLPNANEPVWSPKNLEAECFKDVAKLQLTSKSRIFVIRTAMTPITEEQKKRIETEGDEEILVKKALSAPAALPGQPGAVVPAISGGLTRKGRKGKKKRKTRRRARKLPFKKR